MKGGEGMKPEQVKGLLKACLCLALSLGGMVLCVVLFMIIAQVSGNELIANIFSGADGKGTMEIAMGSLIGAVVQDTALIAVPILLAVYGWKNKAADLGLTSLQKDGKDFLIGILAGTLGITVVLVCLLVSGSVKITDISTKYVGEVSLGLLTYIVVGFAEEIFNRGGLMLALKQTKSKVLIIGIQAVIFGMMHLGNNGVSIWAVINLILFGVFTGYCFYRSGNIWLPIGFHIAWNFVQGNVYGFHVSGMTDSSLMNMKVVKETIFTGAAFGPEGGLGVTISLVLLMLSVVYYYRKRQKSQFEQE